MEKVQDNKLPFFDLLVSLTEPEFRSSVYDKPTFTEQYLNFNFRHPYNVKKGIFRCLQHRAKAISCDIDAYQQEMINLRHNLHCNNYPDSITSAPRNQDRTIENDTRKLTIVRLPSVKSLAERIQKICNPWHQDYIYWWLNSPVLSLPCQTTNRIQHDQQLRVLHPLQLW